MKVTIIMLTVFPFAVFLLFYTLNRGKARIMQLFADTLYSLLIGIPLIFGSMYRWETQKPRFLLILWIIPLVLMAPFLVSKWRNVIKGRESALQAITFTSALAFFYAILFFTPVQALASVAVGMIFLVVFFYYHYRYPYMNAGWLYSLIEKTAGEIVHKGRYSPKPVLVKIETSSRYFTGTSGFSLLSKQNLVVCRISKTLHQKLGSPNLEEFFILLCTKIQTEIK